MMPVKPGKDGLPTYINLIQWLRKNKFLNLSRSLSGDPQKDLLLLAPVVRQYDQAIHRVYKDLAFKAQEELEKCLLILTTHLFKKTRSENLCMAGGVALNSVANKKILDQGLFKSLFIQPAATDDGNAIGAAMYGYFKIFNGKNRFVLRNAFLGREYSQKEIENSLEKFFLFKARRYDDFQELIGFIATEISKGKVVGWFQGGSEFGQRALGNRSILADPRRRNMRDHLNFKVKGRESFRPFAPAVLFEYLSEYFVFEKESPFMLMVAPVKKGKISKIPAVTHIDGTARIQTVRREDNPKFYDLIKNFFEITGVPMLLNTSFNIKGYPMVETPSDAIWSFLNAPIDYLVMGNYLLNQVLYSDLELMSYKPYKLVKIQEDYSSKPKSFVYDYDINRQEATILSDLEKEVLGYCEGKRTVQNLVDQHFVDRKQTLNMIRKFLRRQWIYLLLPN